MKFSVAAITFASVQTICNGWILPQVKTPPLTFRPAETTVTTMMMSTEDAPVPTTFREAEVLGLRLMQEGNFEEALIGT